RIDFEVVVIDDGSKNCSQIENYVRGIDTHNVTYLYQENRGVSSARNKGVSSANGEYIIFVDSDDIVKSEQLEIFDEVIDSYDVDGVFSSYEFWDSHSNIVTEREALDSGIYKNFFSDFSRGIQPFLVGGLCVKKSTFIQTTGFNEEYCFGEDQSFWIDLIYGYDIFSINKVTHRYRIDTIGSLSK
ncbi:glycosyltransferase family 2 protein, partial [Vibrio campbellii]